MSRTLKRPMFRKGGEVMEGVMTGIKPRENFAIKGMSDDVAQNIQSRINLIDAFAGTSPLSDPLTQFLLTSGPALVEGKAAGGTKLQEIIGGIKPGLDRATKMQQMKDLSRQKIAASVISKMGTGGLQKYVQQAIDAFKFDPQLKQRYGGNVQKYALELFNQARFRQGKSSETIAREAEERDALNISKMEQPGLGTISLDASRVVARAKKSLEPEMKANIDPVTPYVHPSLVKAKEIEYKEDGTIIVKESAQDEFTSNSIYYDFPTKQWVQYSNGVLRPVMSNQS
tara:strand:- start:149 stop:1003 length:855 start_codon:yes stop_codon:yes gene_type:complete